MGLADDMKRMGEEMITSYKQRMHENEVLVEEVKNTLEGFRKDQQEMSNDLRNHLKGGESKRHDEFNEMMTGIHNTIRNISQEVENIRASSHSLLKVFKEEHFTMGETLRENFKNNESARFEEYNEMMNGIHVTMEDISKEVDDIRTSSQSMINDFSVDRSNLSESMRNQMKTNNSNRLKQYQETIGNIQNRVNEISGFTANLLGEFRNENTQMWNIWRNFSQEMASMKNNSEMSPKQKTEILDNKKSKKVDQIAAKMDMPVMTEIPSPQKQETVEEKVFDFINAHPQGVKISEMEEPIGEQRMRLGYVAKRLLEKGKVRKLENVYYPLETVES